MTKEPKYLNNICDIHCPFLKEYEHPYYGISAWCDKTHKEIPLYDNEYISKNTYVYLVWNKMEDGQRFLLPKMDIIKNGDDYEIEIVKKDTW